MILGTAQLAADYGIHNLTGRPSYSDSIMLLKSAYESGIKVLDTAPAYGNAERVIGDFHKKYPAFRFDVCSKLPPDIIETSGGKNLARCVREKAETTLASVNAEQLYCYYLHRFEHCKSEELMEGMYEVRRSGLSKYIGVSIYQPEELRYLAENFEDLINVVQIPINVFSKHLWNDELVNAHRRGMHLFARSIYLQGLVFMDPDDPFAVRLGASRYIKELQNIAAKYKRSVVDICYASIIETPEIIDVLVGCETKKQLEQNLNLMKAHHESDPAISEELARCMNDVPEQVINPTLWNAYREVKQ